jgi:hypothetical protein
MQCRHCAVNMDIPWSQTLSCNAPQAPYKRGTTNVMHYGQLKLLLSEIQFLNHVGNWHGSVLIYAGASPGLHIPTLLRLHPGLRLVLVDPQPNIMRNSARVRVIRAYLTDDLAYALACQYGENILFVSDIRIGGGRNESDDEQQARIHRDMVAQMNWHRIMSPRASLMKFRLPWTVPFTDYLSGIIYLPVYGKKLTHEARLLVFRGAPVIRYDNKLYEGQMAYFNQFIRRNTYPGGQCFDCYTLRQLVGEEHGRQIMWELERESVRWLRRRRQCKPKAACHIESFKGRKGSPSRPRRWDCPPWISSFKRAAHRRGGDFNYVCRQPSYCWRGRGEGVRWAQFRR